MKLISKSVKSLFLVAFFACLMANATFAYGWRVNQFGIMFERKDGTFPKETWEWIDGDNSGNAYRYYFDANGFRLEDTITPDYEIVDDQGRWLDDGVLKVMPVNTLSPNEFARLLMMSGNIDEYENYASNTIIGDGISLLERHHLDEEAERQRQARLVASRSMVIIGQGVDPEILKKDEKGNIISGKSKLVDNIIAGQKYTKEVKSIKIYSGSTWRGVMSLNGDGSYMEFENGRYNKVIGKIAHAYYSTKTDTECKVHAYVDGILVATFEDFNYRTSPETIEFYFPTTTKKIRLEAEVTGSSTTRKVYLRDFRFKIDRTVDDEELLMELEGFDEVMNDDVMEEESTDAEGNIIEETKEGDEEAEPEAEEGSDSNSDSDGNSTSDNDESHDEDHEEDSEEETTKETKKEETTKQTEEEPTGSTDEEPES